MTEQASNPSDKLADGPADNTKPDPLADWEADRESSYNQGLTKLDPAQRTLFRITATLAVIPLVLLLTVAGFALQSEVGFPASAFYTPAAIIALLIITFLPHRKYRRWGYDMGLEQLRVLRGFLWRTDTIVPFNRIQHIDVAQGPLQRMFGLSTLVVHTAGTHNSIVTLPGLPTAEAEGMRETIKGHIRKDMI